MFTTMSKHFSFRTMKTFENFFHHALIINIFFSRALFLETFSLIIWLVLLHHVHQLNVFQDPRANDKFFHSWKIDIAAPLLII